MISPPFVPVPPVKYGGTELIVASLVDGLTRRGHRVTLYTTGDSTLEGVERRALYGTGVWPPDPFAELNHVAFAVRDVVARGEVDLVHAHTPSALAFAWMLEPPVVYTIHQERSARLSELYRLSKSGSLTMVAISRRQRELVDDACPARVVHHGLVVDRYPQGQGDGAYVAFLGRLAREKGPASAIDAARRAGVPIRIAGRPHLPRDDVYFATELRPRLAKPGVTWIGDADHATKITHLGGAIATLCPLDWEEPFGLVMAESMLCGTPVIAFGRGAAPELVDDGVTGWLVADVAEMSSRILALASGRLPFDRAQCRARAAQRFHVDRMIDRYEALYREAVGTELAATSALS
jgi:glycosyltransferase involved in cell wall biosynthesis